MEHTVTDATRDATPCEVHRLRFLALLGLAVALRLVIAACSPLGVDEAYAVAIAREFSWSFFDHPPLGFWAPVVAARLSGLEWPLILRLPDLLFGALAAWFVYLIGEALAGRRAGLFALALFGFAPAFALAGVLILPDGPLAPAAALAVLWLVRIVKAGSAATVGQWLWVGGGLALGLASKYQAGLIPLSVLAFALATPGGRRWFATPGPYAASALGLVGLAPVLWWNAQNGWASFAFHVARTGDGLQAANFARMALGQALYLTPPVLVLGLVGIRAAIRSRDAAQGLVAAVALGPVVAFNLVYLFSAESFPHWTMLGWQFAMPLAGVWLARVDAARRRRALGWVAVWAGLTWALLLVTVLHLNTGLLTRLGVLPPAWDRTTDAFDYRGLAPALAARGDLEGVALIASPYWIDAGAMSLAFAGRLPIRVLWGNPHHFGFMRANRRGGTALLLAPDTIARARAALPELLARAREIDPQARALAPVILPRGGRDYAAVNVIRLHLPERSSEAPRP